MELYNLVSSKKHKARFHTPGHAGKTFLCAEWDVTELDDTDNLQNPTGVIRRAEKRAATAYKVSDALYFTSGATTAIFVALQTVAELGIKKVCPINISGGVNNTVFRTHHKAFDVGARFAGLTVVDDVEKDACAFVTSPNYYGQCMGLNELESIKKKAGLLVVDSAHGAHFAFSKLLPDCASSVADLVVISPHKTMPVLTGGALLLVGKANLSEYCKKHRADLHTTSPSYPIMATLDYAVSHFSEKGEAYYEKVVTAINNFKKQNSHLDFFENSDPTRLVINTSNVPKNIYPELVDDGKVVYIVNPYNYMHLNEIAKGNNK